MEVKATAKSVGLTPTKVRLVLDLIRGKDVKEAQAILRFTPRASAPVISKLLTSAVANATHNHSLDEDKLYVKACYADEAPVLKRWMPRAKGRADQIIKRSSHITVVVDERE
jgi:large subunit ribosomal protein L22